MSDKKILVGDMSRETAIGILKLMLEAMEVYDSLASTSQRRNAVQMAIASLETDEAYQLEYERTTKNDLGVDYISKQEVVGLMMHIWGKNHSGDDAMQECIDAIRVMSSVTPQELEQYYKDLAESYEKTITKLTKAIAEQEPRKGMRWIGRFEIYEWGAKEEWCECPWYHMDSAEAYNFCPNCGADFREVKKSEDKE